MVQSVVVSPPFGGACRSPHQLASLADTGLALFWSRDSPCSGVQPVPWPASLSNSFERQQLPTHSVGVARACLPAGPLCMAGACSNERLSGQGNGSLVRTEGTLRQRSQSWLGYDFGDLRGCMHAWPQCPPHRPLHLDKGGLSGVASTGTQPQAHTVHHRPTGSSPPQHMLVWYTSPRDGPAKDSWQQVACCSACQLGGSCPGDAWSACSRSPAARTWVRLCTI